MGLSLVSVLLNKDVTARNWISYTNLLDIPDIPGIPFIPYVRNNINYLINPTLLYCHNAILLTLSSHVSV